MELSKLTVVFKYKMGADGPGDVLCCQLSPVTSRLPVCRKIWRAMNNVFVRRDMSGWAEETDFYLLL